MPDSGRRLVLYWGSVGLFDNAGSEYEWSLEKITAETNIFVQSCVKWRLKWNSEMSCRRFLA